MNFFYKRSRWAVVKKKTRWELKQELAAPDRFYGDDGTIHRTTTLDIETHNGKVVAVWFRCQMIAFGQFEVDADRAAEMERATAPRITGIQVEQ
jgi:hypothetical protein